MKHIALLDKAAETGARFKDIDINSTFGAAYFYSLDAENELINFAEVIWDYDIDPILAYCITEAFFLYNMSIIHLSQFVHSSKISIYDCYMLAFRKRTVYNLIKR